MRRPAFTLVEILVGIGISALVMTGAWTLARNVLSFNTTAYDGLAAQADLLKIVNVWAQEIRASAPAETGAYPVVAAATSTFAFYSDIDDDGVVERVRYFLSGTTLRKGVLKPSGSPLGYAGNETVADQVRNVVASAGDIFQYYDASYAGSASATAPLPAPVNLNAVRLVRITVSSDRDPKRPPGPVQVTTEVSLRNLKDNQ